MMSRTKRKIVKGFKPIHIEEGGDAQVDGWHKHLRIKPYTKDKKPMKYRADKTDHVGGYSKGVSKSDKLIVKNANRSMKKAFRQQLKRELNEEIDNLD